MCNGLGNVDATSKNVVTVGGKCVEGRGGGREEEGGAGGNKKYESGHSGKQVYCRHR